MDGDGLTDIVRVCNADVCYWPNLGYGRFGAKVTMRDAPLFDSPERFDPSAVRLFDISGTGRRTSSILAVVASRPGSISAATPGAPQTIDPFPGTEKPNTVSVLDLLGNGTGCVVWSSELPANATAPLRYDQASKARRCSFSPVWEGSNRPERRASF